MLSAHWCDWWKNVCWLLSVSRWITHVFSGGNKLKYVYYTNKRLCIVYLDFTNLYNQLKFIHFDNAVLSYFFSLMKPINIFRLLHVWLIDIKSVRIIRSFLFIFSLKQSDATFIGYAHLITSMRRDHCTVYVLINVCGQMSSNNLCVFLLLFFVVGYLIIFILSLII